jgi:hypothetical protein
MIAAAAIILTSSSPANATLLFSDNFTVTGTTDAQNLNYNLAGRQSGSVVTGVGGSTVNWLNGAGTTTPDWKVQAGFAGTLDGGNSLTMFWADTAWHGRTTLDHDFSNVQSAISVGFDVQPAGWSGGWGASQFQFGVKGGPTLRSVFICDGNYQLFAPDGVGGDYQVGSGVYSATAVDTAPAHINVVFSNAATGGSPFGAASVLVQSYSNGSSTPFFSATVAGTPLSSGYVSLESWEGAQVEFFDNVSVSSVPEPASMMLLGSGLIGLLAYAWRKRK